MTLFNYTNPHMIVADKGKHIREKNDIYVPEHEEDGKIVPEHFPNYSTIIFVPDSFTEEMMNDLYVEEIIK